MSFLMYVLVAIGVLAVADIIRMILGPTIFDRLLAFNILCVKIVMAMMVYALMTDQSFMLDIAVCYVLLSFVSTVLIARYIRTKGVL